MACADRCAGQFIKMRSTALSQIKTSESLKRDVDDASGIGWHRTLKGTVQVRMAFLSHISVDVTPVQSTDTKGTCFNCNFPSTTMMPATFDDFFLLNNDWSDICLRTHTDPLFFTHPQQ